MGGEGRLDREGAAGYLKSYSPVNTGRNASIFKKERKAWLN